MSDGHAPETPMDHLTKSLIHADDTASWTKALLEAMEPFELEGVFQTGFDIPPQPFPSDEEKQEAALRDDGDVSQVKSYADRVKEWEKILESAQKEFLEKKKDFMDGISARLHEIMRVNQHQALARLNLSKAQTEFTINIFNILAVLCMGGELPNEPNPPIVVKTGLFTLMNNLGNSLGAGGLIRPPGS